MDSRSDGGGVGPLAVLTEGYTERNRFIDDFKVRKQDDMPLVVSHGVPSPKGSGRIDDACGESPAASLLWLGSLGEVQIIRSVFVHHSFIIRSYSCIMQTKPSKRHVAVSWGDLWVSWEHLGEA